MLIFALVAIGTILALTKSTGKESTAMITPPSVSTWEPIIAALAVPKGFDEDGIRFALKWIELESGGNPCAVGNVNAKGPDGNPREMGIAQFYNPDDLNILKIKGSDLRAYCIPGTQHLSRPLTPDEMTFQAQKTIDLINLARASAEKDARKAGLAWDRSSRDFYSLIKLQHGLPGISRSGLPAVNLHLGHPPRDWKEFVDTLPDVILDSHTEQYRADFDRILANTEKCASIVTEKGVA